MSVGYETAVAGPATPETERAEDVARRADDRVRQIVIEELHRQLDGFQGSRPHGCVCPVGAEASCRGLCPRRPIASAVA